MRIRAEADGGTPTVVAAPDSEVARAYEHIALGLAARLAAGSKDYSRLFPSISIEES
jgi:ATP-binding protein involved in chromosome partitioning